MDETRVLMKYRLPLAEVVTDFYDELKSRTSGYATFDYEENGYEISDLVKVCRTYALFLRFPRVFGG
jgi:translation elongation factor EF-4